MRSARRRFIEGAVSQLAVVFQYDEGVLEKQGPAKWLDRARLRSRNE